MSSTFGKRDQRGQALKAGTVPAQAVTMRYPFDPVLRMALIRKGVITSDDLREAELTIQATTGQMVAEAEEQGGESTA